MGEFDTLTVKVKNRENLTMFSLFLLIYVAFGKDDFMAPPPRPPPMPPSVKSQLIQQNSEPYKMQVARFLPRMPSTVEKKSDRVLKTKTDDRHIIAPVVSSVTKANNKSSAIKQESKQIETLQQALLTQKAGFERKLFDAKCRIQELEALLRGAKNRHRDCRDNARKNHLLFSELISS